MKQMATKNKTNMNKYNYILSMFVSDEHYKKNMVKPFLDEDFYCATDSFTICFIPKINSLYEYQSENPPKALETLRKYEATFNEEISIDKDFLMNCFTQLKWEYEYKDCEECEGKGFKTCMCCDNETDCEECDGTGESNEQKPFCDMKLLDDKIFLIDRYFDSNQINKILLTACVLETDQIAVKFQKEATTEPVLFEIKDCKILALPRQI